MTIKRKLACLNASLALTIAVAAPALPAAVPPGLKNVAQERHFALGIGERVPLQGRPCCVQQREQEVIPHGSPQDTTRHVLPEHDFKVAAHVIRP